MSPTTPTMMLLRLDPITPFPCSNDFLVSNIPLFVFELGGLTCEPYHKTGCRKNVLNRTLSLPSPPLAVCFEALPSWCLRLWNVNFARSNLRLIALNSPFRHVSRISPRVGQDPLFMLCFTLLFLQSNAIPWLFRQICFERRSIWRNIAAGYFTKARQSKPYTVLGWTLCSCSVPGTCPSSLPIYVECLTFLRNTRMCAPDNSKNYSQRFIFHCTWHLQNQ